MFVRLFLFKIFINKKDGMYPVIHTLDWSTTDFNDLYFTPTGVIFLKKNNISYPLTQNHLIYGHNYYQFADNQWYTWTLEYFTDYVNTNDLTNKVELAFPGSFVGILGKNNMELNFVNHQINATFIPKNSPKNTGIANFLYKSIKDCKIIYYIIIINFNYLRQPTVVLNVDEFNYHLPINETIGSLKVDYIASTDTHGRFKISAPQNLNLTFIDKSTTVNDNSVFGPYTLAGKITSSTSTSNFDFFIHEKSLDVEGNIHWVIGVKASKKLDTVNLKEAIFSDGSLDVNGQLITYTKFLTIPTITDLVYFCFYEGPAQEDGTIVSIKEYHSLIARMNYLFTNCVSTVNNGSLLSVVNNVYDVNETLTLPNNIKPITTLWAVEFDNKKVIDLGYILSDDTIKTILAAYFEGEELNTIFETLSRYGNYTFPLYGIFITQLTETSATGIPFSTNANSNLVLLPEDTLLKNKLIKQSEDIGRPSVGAFIAGQYSATRTVLNSIEVIMENTDTVFYTVENSHTYAGSQTYPDMQISFINQLSPSSENGAFHLITLNRQIITCYFSFQVSMYLDNVNEQTECYFQIRTNRSVGPIFEKRLNVESYSIKDEDGFFVTCPLEATSGIDIPNDTYIYGIVVCKNVEAKLGFNISSWFNFYGYYQLDMTTSQ